jgi:serine/threonine protein kinase
MNEETIFATALEKSPDERRRFLEEACAGNAELRASVEALLAASDGAGQFLEKPPADLAPTLNISSDGTHDEHEAWPPDALPELAPCVKPDRIGLLDEYEVIEVVGRGGMATVLRAFDTKLSRVVAVKVMARELAANPHAVKRFLREAKAAANVVHENVVTIHSINDKHRPPYLVMEFVAGQTLQQKIEKQGALDVLSILGIATQTAAGLAAAHKLGLIHRDVKPGNILLEGSGERVKITDFGLARTADDAEVTRAGMIAGTPQFMSPEQARGEALDARSDLFSLGSVMYSMCTGQAAFRAENTMGVLRRVCEQTPTAVRQLNPQIPPWLEAIVEKLLAKEPSQRFASAAELHQLLSECLAHMQHPATQRLPTSLATHHRYLASRKTKRIAVGVIGAGIVAAALAVWRPWEAEPQTIPQPVNPSPMVVNPPSPEPPKNALDEEAELNLELNNIFRELRALERRSPAPSTD